MSEKESSVILKVESPVPHIALHCRYCGAIGHTVAGEKHGTPFSDARALAMHERMCKDNPDRVRYHRRKKFKQKGGELVLKFIRVEKNGSLLYHNGKGEAFIATRVDLVVNK